MLRAHIIECCAEKIVMIQRDGESHVLRRSIGTVSGRLRVNGSCKAHSGSAVCAAHPLLELKFVNVQTRNDAWRITLPLWWNDQLPHATAHLMATVRMRAV